MLLLIPPGGLVPTTVSAQGGHPGGSVAYIMGNTGVSACPRKPTEILELPMLKNIIIIVLSAFTAGLLAETAVTVVQGVQGIFPDIHTAIELITCWVVVVAVFYISVLKAVNNRSW